MKILIIRNAAANDFGGAETYAYNLSTALKRGGVDSLIVTSLKPLVEKCHKNDVPVISGPWNQTQEWSRWYYLRYLYTTFWYIWVIIRHQIDVVSPQGRDDFIFATKAANLLKKPVVWIDHADLKYILDRQNRPNRRLQAWTIAAAARTDAIVSESENEHREVMAVAPELDNLVLIHNGVFAPKDVTPVTKPEGSGLIVGTNARLVAAKGIRELLKGFAGSSLRGSGSLWIIGSENDDRQDYYDYAAELGIKDRVTFWGYVEKPNDYVAAMDIFVHASYHEAFSLAIIEAAMLGRPIIATAVGGTPELIDASCGILIPAKSSDAIRDAIDRLARDDELRNRLADQAYQKAHKDFDFDKIVTNKLIPLFSDPAGYRQGRESSKRPD